MSYDPNNVFARILRREIPVTPLYEDEFTLAFRDANPQALHHILVVPKGAYTSFYDFAARASLEEVGGLNQAIRKVVTELGLEKTGFRLLANHGFDAGQEVPHYHVHILGGEPLGPLLAKRSSQQDKTS